MALQAPSIMSALGFSKRVERDYERLLGQSGRELVSVAHALLRTPEELLHDVRPLLEVGIVRVESSRVHVATPAEAVALLLHETAQAATLATTRLEGVARALPHLVAPAARPKPGEVLEVQPIDGEISSGGNPVPLLHALITESAGDLLWLRPDQFRKPREDAMAAVVGEAVQQGRASRAIYPYRAWSEARPTLELRASVGEQIRLLPELPDPDVHHRRHPRRAPGAAGLRRRAAVPGPAAGTRPRAHAVVRGACGSRPARCPASGQERGDRPELNDFVLRELAHGARDEEIARSLGISLRTVRRRVAVMMTELGVDSRFQAGVEAVRRGWL